MKDDITKLANELRSIWNSRIDKSRPFIVGMDGLGGAGKTTLTQQLKQELQQTSEVFAIHLDNHIVERSRRYHTGYEEWYEYYNLQWNLPMLTEDLFKTLHQRQTKLSLPFYNLSLDKQTMKTIPVSPETILLIEGVFLQRKEWESYFDFTVFIDCPKEIRYERVLKRDAYLGDEQARVDKYKRRYWLAENYYMTEVKPQEIADRIYNCM